MKRVFLVIMLIFLSTSIAVAGGKRSLSTNDDKSQYRYEGASGKKYKYDLSKPDDRMNYKLDINSQINDRIDPDPRRNIDRDMNQHGGGGEM